MKKLLLITLLTYSAFGRSESCNPSSIYYEETSKLYSDMMIDINCFDKNIKIKKRKVSLSSLKNPLMTPLKLAIYKGNNKITQELLKNGANIDISDLIVAVRNEDIETVKLLHKYDKNVFYGTINGLSALRHAFYKTKYKKNTEIINLLKSYNVKNDSKLF